jgi:microcystin-dependent protein
MKIKNLLSLDSNRISDVATPTSSNDAANKAYVDAAMPTGTMVQYIADTAPTGWVLCDGSAISRTTYSTLFALIGTTYGAGNGSSTFNIPDLRGRVPMGVGTGAGDGSSGTGAPSGTALTVRARGAWGGGETHTLTSGELASHSHSAGTLTIPTHTHDSGTLAMASHTHSFTPAGTVSSHTHTFYANRFTNTSDVNGSRVRISDLNSDGSGYSSPTAVTTAGSIPTFTGTAGNTGSPSATTVSGSTGSTISANGVSGSTGSTAAGTSHNNTQPFVVVSFIIKT